MAWPAAIGGHCGEVIANLDTAGNDASRVARVDTEGSCIVEPYPSGQFAGLVNLFVCEGAPGPVLEVEVKGIESDVKTVSQRLCALPWRLWQYVREVPLLLEGFSKSSEVRFAAM